MMVWALVACGPETPAPTVSHTDPPTTAETGAAPEPVCPVFGEPEVAGVVLDDTLTEASGLARAGGDLWTHNDSGEALLYRLGDEGQVIGRVPVRQPIFDLEDIAARGDALWLADVGDNAAVRQTLVLLELPVPELGAAEAVPRVVTTRWPDGPVDSETLLADPVSGDLLLVSKQWDSGVTRVARVDPDAADTPLEVVAEVQFGSGGIGSTPLVTGGDVAPDGSGVVLRTYLSAWWFPRRPGEAWDVTFGRTPCEVPLLGEGQGEALAVDAGWVWTVSEGSDPPLNRVSWAAR